MGLGTRGGGLGVATYLSTHGAIVTVTDNRTTDQLQEPIASLAGLPIAYSLGGHQERDFTSENADIVIRNPAVRRNSPWLELARTSGVAVEMEMSLFLRRCPAPVIGITGTKGKSTTSALAGEMLKAWRPDAVVAGNMGISAVAHLDAIAADTPVLLEISSWQLEGLDEHGLASHIGVLTNISQDHLDAYDTFDDYADCKRSIAHHMKEIDYLIVNSDDPEAMKAIALTEARIIRFSSVDPEADVVALDREVRWNLDGRSGAIALPDRPHYRGAPLRANVAAAVAAAMVRGAPVEAIEQGLAAFQGVANRSEFVATIDGVDYINDTAATAPAAATAALAALQGRTAHVLAGGSDKKSDLTPLAGALAASAATVTLLDGTATPALEALLRKSGTSITGVFGSMAEAVHAARAVASPGDVVLLSPGCASFGLFRDEFDRGEQFRQAVRSLVPTEEARS
ncbi:MAG: UDP-N-acetylmuramoyl-L-alanine--D-glutamate ligase [Thermomicrobiales bacterium]|nr:UDP-N-acetylmuramoyl-L-alanine--D-glutamate ligase [Thermomicrobiales bacterium]